MILCDAGPLFALIDKKQSQHAPIRTAVTKLSMPLITRVSSGQSITGRSRFIPAADFLLAL
jgi:hypothetical protein